VTEERNVILKAAGEERSRNKRRKIASYKF
jgi:hypothetical protein